MGLICRQSTYVCGGVKLKKRGKRKEKSEWRRFGGEKYDESVGHFASRNKAEIQDLEDSALRTCQQVGRQFCFSFASTSLIITFYPCLIGGCHEIYNVN